MWAAPRGSHGPPNVDTRRAGDGETAPIIKGDHPLRVDPDKLRQRLRYEPETGKLFWKAQAPEAFEATATRTAEHTCANWNALFSEREAFTATNRGGYRFGKVFGEVLLAHRVIWAMQTGYWPTELDHINGVRDDNRWGNLRLATRSENASNRAVRADSATGVIGVTVIPETGMFRAKIKRIHIGCFSTKEAAEEARKAAAIRLGFHENHGRPPTQTQKGNQNG